MLRPVPGNMYYNLQVCQCNQNFSQASLAVELVLTTFDGKHVQEKIALTWHWMGQGLREVRIECWKTVALASRWSPPDRGLLCLSVSLSASPSLCRYGS